MYVDGYILLGFYVMLVIALLFGIYNFVEVRELQEKVNRRPTTVKQPKTREPIKVPRAKGHWD
jgi:hypothetical protein